MPGQDDDFYQNLPLFDGFARVADPGLYSPLPADWVVGFADVEGSTALLQEGHYKAVNMAGAAVIAAVSNALERRLFPYCFGGDGASFAVAPGDAGLAAMALQGVSTFAREEFGIVMRIAMLGAAEIRASKRDVTVARFAASEHSNYAMFSGGGLAWFEGEVKSGRFQLDPAPAGARANLEGLSCRWKIAPAAQGVVLSLIVVPLGQAGLPYKQLVEDIVRLADQAHQGGRPITASSLKTEWPGKGLELETAASLQPGQTRYRRRLAILAQTFLATVFLRFRLKTSVFDAPAYVADVAANADFRKFDDGLKMTLDCTPELADVLEARLEAASDIAVHGTFRQNEALMTCFVPSITERNHVHFVDGAGGGYALAAKAMKERLRDAA